MSQKSADAALTASAWLARVRALEGRGELLLAYDVAQQGLTACPDDLWLRHRAVLVLAKAGATARARAELQRLSLVGHAEAEIAALEARLAKDAALAAPPEQRRDLLLRAADLYERVYRRAGGYYPGINLASLRLLAGDVATAERVAGEVLPLCDQAAGDGFYAAVTRAEALLVRGETAALADDLAARGIDETILLPLAAPTVITYTGHMIAAPGAAGRFPAGNEARVARDIVAALDRHGVGFGYGPLASGSDTLFAEALLARGGRTDVIACGAGGIPAAPPTSGRAPSSPRQLRAMLFGDVKGFSRLQEAQIPAFVQHVLGAFGTTLERHGASVLYANSWGDGLFIVLDDAASAAACALDLQAAMTGIDLAALGLPDILALRLGGHFGPVFETEDPVQHVTNFFGVHVSRTARIEPVTPPGEVYVTEPFAARLALGSDGFASDYVGQVPAAKDYGTMRMYHLRRG